MIKYFLSFAACYANLVNGGFLFDLSNAEVRYSSCVSSTTLDCSINSFVEGDTVLVYPGGSTKCAFGGNDNPYFFQVQRGQGIDANNLIINFQGGGACSSADECREGTFRKSPAVVEGGIFDTSENRNPFASWTSVAILYCTGDIHIGNAVLDPDTSPIYFNGRINVQAVLDWINVNIPDPDRVLITGTSAGSIGAQFWSRPLISYYKNLPSPPVMGIIFDSSLGTSSGSDSLVISSLFNFCSSDLELNATEISDCEDGTLDLMDLQRATQAANRDIPFAFILNKADSNGVKNFCDTSDTICTAEHFYEEVQDVLFSYTVSQPDNNVVSYLGNSALHVIITNLRFFSGNEGEPTVADWVRNIAYHDNLGDVVSSCRDGGTPEPGIDYTCNSTLTNAYFTLL